MITLRFRIGITLAMVTMAACNAAIHYWAEFIFDPPYLLFGMLGSSFCAGLNIVLAVTEWIGPYKGSHQMTNTNHVGVEQ